MGIAKAYNLYVDIAAKRLNLILTLSFLEDNKKKVKWK